MYEVSCCVCDRTLAQVRNRLKLIDTENKKIDNAKRFENEESQIKQYEKEKSDYAQWVKALKDLESKEHELLVSTIISEKDYFGSLSETITDIATYLNRKDKKASVSKLKLGQLIGLLSDYEPVRPWAVDYDKNMDIEH